MTILILHSVVYHITTMTKATISLYVPYECRKTLTVRICISGQNELWLAIES